MVDIARLVERRDWWDDLGARQEFLRQWFGAPRQTCDAPRPPAPDGYAPCPCPAVGWHLLEPGHMFTDDGWCWVPEDET